MFVDINYGRVTVTREPSSGARHALRAAAAEVVSLATSMKIAVAGSGGFVGSAVVVEARRQGLTVLPISSPRIYAPRGVGAADAVESWIANQREAYKCLVTALRGTDVVINAAGFSAPDNRGDAALYGANSALPGVLASAAASADVRRMIHVSSAAAQGRRNPLDETGVTAPVTPYGESKARGEEVLLRGQLKVPPEIVLYRPTSVQGVNRPMTHRLVRLASLPAIPLASGGEAPLPVTLIENVAAGIMEVCRAQMPPSIVLQPWEGMTVKSLFECFGRARVVRSPAMLTRYAIRCVYASGRLEPRAAALGRRLELLACGQEQQALALTNLGFIPPSGPEAYVRLADDIRARSRGHREAEPLPPDRRMGARHRSKVSDR